MSNEYGGHIGRVAGPMMGERHSGKWADTRARGVEIAAAGVPGDDFSHILAISEIRRRPAFRTSAGTCPSCDGPIDASTGECRCSA